MSVPLSGACRIYSVDVVERLRTAGVCPLCGARVTQVVDDLMVNGKAYDTQVLRARCTPGCPGVESDD